MTPSTHATDYVYVPLPASLYAELILRSGKANIAPYIESQISSFLDATEGDPDFWSADYIEKLSDRDDDEFWKQFGNPSRGYQWQNVFLSNGTKLRMSYKGTAYYAEIRHEKLLFNGEMMSPSQFARGVANNTSRNAWNDIFVQFPGDAGWKSSDDLRRQDR